VSPEGYTYPGGAITVSANGNTNGIVWAVQKNGDTSPGVLFAYDARNVGTELYNSTQAGSRDTLDIAAKFTPSTIVNGKVFIGSMNQLTVYGLLP
jgi:outer membrane protein assembly factor BamB